MQMPRITSIRCPAKTISLITCHLKREGEGDYKQSDKEKEKAEQVQSGLVYCPAHFCPCYNPEI